MVIFNNYSTMQSLMPHAATAVVIVVVYLAHVYTVFIFISLFFLLNQPVFHCPLCCCSPGSPLVSGNTPEKTESLKLNKCTIYNVKILQILNVFVVSG